MVKNTCLLWTSFILSFFLLSTTLCAVQLDEGDYQDKISALFEDGVHKFNEKRSTHVSHWLLGFPENKPSTLEDRHNWMSFLNRHWENAYFRPFDGIEGAQQELIRNQNINYIIRLSTRESGRLTLTFRGPNYTFLHTRIKILGEDKLLVNKKVLTFEQLLQKFGVASASTYIQ